MTPDNEQLQQAGNWLVRLTGPGGGFAWLFILALWGGAVISACASPLTEIGGEVKKAVTKWSLSFLGLHLTGSFKPKLGEFEQTLTQWLEMNAKRKRRSRVR